MSDVEHEERIADLERMLDEARQRGDELERQLEAQRGWNDELAQQSAAQVRDIEDLHRRLDQDVPRLHEQVALAEAAHEQALNDQAVLRREKDRLQSELDAISSEPADDGLREELDRVTAEREDIRARHVRTLADLAVLRAELAQCRISRQSLEEDLAAAERSAGRAVTESDARTQVITELVAERDQLRAELMMARQADSMTIMDSAGQVPVPQAVTAEIAALHGRLAEAHNLWNAEHNRANRAERDMEVRFSEEHDRLQTFREQAAVLVAAVDAPLPHSHYVELTCACCAWADRARWLLGLLATDGEDLP